jgi:hypothetical protein
MVAWLIVMFALGIYPASHFAEWLPVSSKTITRIIGIAVLAMVISGLGYEVWPPIKRHMLEKAERVAFENALKAQKGSDLNVEIGCPAGDETTCVYAGQFVRLFGEAGWNVQTSVARLTLSKAQDGVIVYRRGGNKEDMMKRWDSGGWFGINEPHS